MRELRALTPDELARQEYRLLHPVPGSRMEAARVFGIDLTLLITQLRLTPAERVAKLERAAKVIERVRGAARRRA